MPVERIADAADRRLAEYRELPDPAPGRREGLFVVEGRSLVRRLLAGSRFRARSVLLTEPMLESLHDVIAEALPVYVVGEQTIRSVVGFAFHRGCVALGERGPEPPFDALLAARRLVLLERVANPDNVGGIFRNAAAFGVDAVLLSPGCADPLYRRAVRVSMGGVLAVPFATLTDWPAAMARLRATGFTVVGLTPDGTVDVAELGRTPRRVALVLGTEGDGLSRETRESVDILVAIRMAPGDHSLNVATACGIALHHLTAQQTSE